MASREDVIYVVPLQANPTEMRGTVRVLFTCWAYDTFHPAGPVGARVLHLYILRAVSTPHGMLAQIPLTDDERAAVEDGSAAVDRLLERLADTPTPAGLSPRELAQSPTFIPLTSLSVSAARKE